MISRRIATKPTGFLQTEAREPLWVVHEDDDLAFLSYDDEPTRVAIVRQPVF